MTLLLDGHIGPLNSSRKEIKKMVDQFHLPNTRRKKASVKPINIVHQRQT